MQRREISATRHLGSTLTTNSVLRNTYMLLSLTLLFSAGAAAFAVYTNAGVGASLVAIIGSFVLLFATNALRNSAWGLLTVFAFTGCMGYSMGPLLNYFLSTYTNGSNLIMTALGGTGLAFFASSFYVITTKKDLSAWGKTLTTGLIVCLVAIIGNIFLQMPAIQLAISSMLIFLSVFLMMYDTSRIINNGETNYIMATIALYIDIQMLFQNLLMLLGALGGNRD